MADGAKLTDAETGETLGYALATTATVAKGSNGFGLTLELQSGEDVVQLVMPWTPDLWAWAETAFEAME